MAATGGEGLTAGEAAPRRGPSGELGSATLAERIGEIAASKKAIDVVVLDLRGIVSYTDYFIVCSGNTERQAKAIHDAVHKELKDGEGVLPRSVEGALEARWILMDYLDCVLHVFTREMRAHYRLEQLWGEAPSRMVE